MPDPALPRGAVTLVFAVAAFVTLFALPTLARAADVSPLEPWLAHDSAQCLPVAPLSAVAKVVELAPAQFEFARALYVAIPPISHALPPGDRAIVAVAGDETMIALVDGDQTCARMAIPDFIFAELMAVGRGDVTHAGTGL